MWHIRDIKQRANLYLHTAYGRSVAAALVLGIATSAVTGLVMELGLSVMSALPQIDFGTLYGEMSAMGLLVNPALLMTALNLVFFGGLVTALVGLSIDLFLMKPIEVGTQRFFIVNHAFPGRSRCAEFFHVFGDHYLNVVWTMLLKTVYTILWGCLLVIPGWIALTFVPQLSCVPYPVLIPLAFPALIKHYAYRLVPYILAEESGMDFDDVFVLSRRMMKGNKWHAFLLDLSFLGWQILNVFTLGILGLLYVGPRRRTANAELYITLRDQYLHRG